MDCRVFFSVYFCTKSCIRMDDMPLSWTQWYIYFPGNPNNLYSIYLTADNQLLNGTTFFRLSLPRWPQRSNTGFPTNHMTKTVHVCHNYPTSSARTASHNSLFYVVLGSWYLFFTWNWEDRLSWRTFRGDHGVFVQSVSIKPFHQIQLRRSVSVSRKIYSE